MMAYQPYYPGGWQPGPSGNTPISADALNHMERQYDEAMADLDAQKTSPGGTEPERLAVTDGDGAVGLARVAEDAHGVLGTLPFAVGDGLAGVTRHTYTTVAMPGNSVRVLADVQGSGVLLGAFAYTPANADFNVRLRIDGGSIHSFGFLGLSDMRLVSIPPIRFNSSLQVEVERPGSASAAVSAEAWVRVD